MIIVLGSINADQIGVVDRLPMPGETVLGSSFRIEPGGKGANQALAARRAGSEVALFAAIGNDPFAEIALALLRRDRVGLTGVRVAHVNTGIAMILVDAAGENQIAVLSGANATVGEQEVRRALDKCSNEDVLLLQLEIPVEAARKALELAKERSLRSILNIAPYVPETGSLAKLASIVVANESEFERLLGSKPTNLDDEVLKLAAQNGQVVVVTLGKMGAVIGAGDKVVRVSAPSIQVVDTVGAGDTFCGYLAAGICAGEALDLAVRRAVVAASIACTSAGAQPAIPHSSEVECMMR